MAAKFAIQNICDVIGHSLKVADVTNHTQYLFQLHKLTNTTISYPALNMHWSVLISPSFFLGIGPLIMMATALVMSSLQLKALSQ